MSNSYSIPTSLFPLRWQENSPSMFHQSLISIKSDEFKFWLSTGLKTLVIACSFYGIYKVLTCMEDLMDNKSKEKRKGKEVFAKLGIPVPPNLDDHELAMASCLMDPNSINTGWKDIAGLETTISDIRRSILTPILNPNNIYSKLYKPPKGLLIYGPPGCGKTMLVKALAKSTNARFLNVQPSSIVDMYYGETEKYINAIFSLARKIQPTIIFIDEIDGLLSTRNTVHSSELYMTAKTMFLTQWDGIQSDDGSQVILVGATNRAYAIDDAILRRLQMKLEVRLPNTNERKQIYKLVLKGEALDDSVTDEVFEYLASNSTNLSGSSINDICHDSVMCAVDRYRSSTGINTDSSTPKFSITADDLIKSLHNFVQNASRIRGI